MSAEHEIVFKTRFESRLKTIKNDVEEFRYVIHKAIQELGFTDYACAAITGEKDYEIDLITVSQDLVKAYIDNEIHQYDFMLECALADNQPTFQRNIFKHILTFPYKTERVEKNKKLKEIMDNGKLYDCLSIPVHNVSNGKKEVMAISVYCKGMSSTCFQRLAKKQMNFLYALARSVYAIGYNKFAKSATATNGAKETTFELTKTEKMILGLFCKHGVRYKVVAEEICKSEFTIQTHAQNIRKKLHVDTTDKAVTIAIKRGLIKL